MFQINLESLKVSQVTGVVQPIYVSSYKQSMIFTESVKAIFGIEDKSTNGPKGTVSSLMQESLHVLY